MSWWGEKRKTYQDSSVEIFFTVQNTAKLVNISTNGKLQLLLCFDIFWAFVGGYGWKDEKKEGIYVIKVCTWPENNKKCEKQFFVQKSKGRTAMNSRGFKEDKEMSSGHFLHCKLLNTIFLNVVISSSFDFPNDL